MRLSLQRVRRSLAVACVAWLAVAGQQASAQRAASDDAGETAAIAFVLGNVEFLLLHEIAHFLIGEKDVPIIGPEENAADYIATLALLREPPLDPARGSRAVPFLMATADAFAASWRTGETLGADVPYWGAHALSIQRFYQIACLLYGSDPVAFESVPDMAGLPRSRAVSCAAEYERAEQSIRWLLANYGRQPEDPPGEAAAVFYEPAPTRVGERIVAALESQQLLELTLGRLRERFTLERPLTVVVRGCGRAEAAWLPERRELVICYDLLDTLYLLALQRRTSPFRP
jgi:hypothetical protein